MKPVFFFLTLCCFIPLISFVAFTPSPAINLAEDVLVHTNQFRQSKGLPGLIMRKELNEIAQSHSADMAAGRVGFGHAGFSTRNSKSKKSISTLNSFAENVAYGAASGSAVVSMWKNSSGHRRNMLGRYKYIGIGTAKDRQGRIYYTQVFAG